MHEKEKDLISAFLRGQTDRRGLLKGLGALGATAASSGMLFNMMSTRALAADFDWKAHKGKSLKLLLASEHSDIVATLVEAAEQARGSEPIPIVVGSSSYPGKSVSDVVRLIVGILRDYRYVGFEATTEATIRLYMNAADEDEQQPILSLGEELAKHHLGVWKSYGPVAQRALMNIADKLPEDTRERCRPLLRTMYDKILSPGVEGTEWASPDTMTISTGSVSASAELGEIRGRAIMHLKDMLATASTDGERQAVISALFRASETPFNAQYTNELALLVLENAKTVTGICRELASGWSFEILQKLEDRMLRLHYAHRAVPPWLTDDPALAAANAELIAEILAFRDEVNTDPQFVTYKTLVGYDSVFPSAWDNDPFDYEARDAWREERIDAMVAEINAENADTWLDTITRCAQTRSDDLATFPTFGNFLAKLAAAKPDVVIGYLDRLDERLAQFLPGMLRGLIDAGRQDFVERKLHGWMGQCCYLDTICFFLKSEMRLDNGLLVLAAERSALDGDNWAVTTSVAAAVSRYAHAADDRLKVVFLNGLQYLTAQNDVRWAMSHFVVWRKSPILSALQGFELDVLFAALLLLPRLEYGIEEMLVTVADQDVDRVIQFLSDRMARERELEADDRYRAVPFTPHKLPKALSAQPTKMVGAARAWFAADGSLFRFRGGHFLAQVFADMPEDYEAELRALLASGGQEEIKMVLAILQNYEGNANIHGLCRDIIEALPEDDRLRTSVTIAIQSTGVVSGEFGMAEAYERRKGLVGPWLEDTRPKVRRFAEEFIHQTDQAIAGEQRRAEEDREFRQRDFEKDE